jgi:hypothetical protein
MEGPMAQLGWVTKKQVNILTKDVTDGFRYAASIIELGSSEHESDAIITRSPRPISGPWQEKA